VIAHYKRSQQACLKSHELAYQKLEKDIEKVVDHVLKAGGSKKKLKHFQVAEILKLMRAFKYLPDELSGQMIRPQPQMDRIIKEETFIEKIWSLMNPLNSQTVASRIVIDFLKLIYDPYMVGNLFSAQNTQQKVDLTLEYVLELRRLAEAEGF
jgi:hypothetical protein